MQRIGTVVRTAQGSIVVRADTDTPPDVGATVIDESLTTVGRIVDIMGPIDRPFVVIRPVENGPAPATLLNERVYVR
ncbi:MAG: Gar1/Naf1 family protein [Halobacteriales archaeon]|nr:Gar1/Naf1 family protein [Halobacteriales archaeon]